MAKLSSCCSSKWRRPYDKAESWAGPGKWKSDRNMEKVGPMQMAVHDYHSQTHSLEGQISVGLKQEWAGEEQCSWKE